MEQHDEKNPLALRVLLSVARAVLIVALFFYVFYHLTNGFSSELETETVNIYNEPLTLSVDGVIVRSETAVENLSGGVVSYRYENGEKVGIGTKLASVYGSGDDAKVVARVAEIDETIDFLSEAGLDKELTAADGIAAGREISEILLSSSDSISRGGYGALAEQEDTLLEAFLLRNAALDGENDSVSKALASLENERARLANSLSDTGSSIYAPKAGYFYDYSDGGESAFDYENITSLTPDEYKAAIGKITGGTAACKMVTLPKWYFVCTLPKAQGASVTEDEKYELFFRMSDKTLTMTLEAKNTVGDESVLVFSTKEMPQGFDFSRFQKVSLLADTVSGYRVPSSALRMVDGTVGVYIRSGNTVKFRVAEVIYESGSYSFVSTDTEGVTLYSSDGDDTNDIYCKGLSLYDNVIVSGAKELYPDRIVN